jgi:hypothetical protein
MRVVDTLYAGPNEPGLGRNEFSTTASVGFVYRTVFIATKPHGIPPDGLVKNGWGGRRRRK